MELASREPDPTGRGSNVVFRGEAKFVQELLGITETGGRPVVYFTQGGGELSLGGGVADESDPKRAATQLKEALTKGQADVRPLAVAALSTLIRDRFSEARSSESGRRGPDPVRARQGGGVVRV